MFESKTGVLLIAGLGFFLFAFLSNAVVPVLIYRKLPEQTALEVVNPNLLHQFEDLSRRYPEEFKRHFGEPTAEKCAEALELGRSIYVGEGCWHCHSQFVRPVSNESRRWGPVAETPEFQNALQRPVMFGTRRVGPDLSREGGRRSNDWHAVHFFRPKLVSTGSPMPEYPWFFEPATAADAAPAKQETAAEAEGDATKKAAPPAPAELIRPGEPTPARPNRRGLAIITYVQWLGSWHDTYPYYEEDLELAEENP
ncbi:MAG: cbb3-type cytochrome c oxidase subunit II [Pirellulales bacterium]